MNQSYTFLQYIVRFLQFLLIFFSEIWFFILKNIHVDNFLLKSSNHNTFILLAFTKVTSEKQSLHSSDFLKNRFQNKFLDRVGWIFSNLISEYWVHPTTLDLVVREALCWSFVHIFNQSQYRTYDLTITFVIIWRTRNMSCQ